VNSNINRTTEKTPFDLILRFKSEMRINIEAAITENSYSTLEETPAARRKIELRERNASLVRDI
jgi:hypothetical protein